MKSKSLQILILLSFVFIFSSHLLGQDTLQSKLTKSEKVRWHIFNHELAIDVQSVFFNSSSATLLFKKRIDKGQFVRVQQTRAYRFMLSIGMKRNTIPSVSHDFQSVIPTPTTIEISNYNYMNIYLGIGKEIQQNFGRFQLYYGADFFMGYSDGDNYISEKFDVLGLQFNNYYRINSSSGKHYFGRYMAGLIALGGVRFFIHPRLSLSTESGLGLGYALIDYKYTNTQKGYQQFIQGTVNAKRFLTVNFHF